MNFQIKLALRYLSRRKWRSVLTTLSIVFGVMILFGMNGLLPAVEGSFRQNLMASTGLVDLTVTSEARGVFDAGQVDVVRRTDGVLHATGSLVRTVILPAMQASEQQDAAQVNTLIVNGLDPDSALDVRPLTLAEGRFLEKADENVILVSTSLADVLALGLGDGLRLPSASGMTEFEIIGIVARSPVPGAENVYMPLAAAQALLNLPGQINTIEALFAPGAQADEVRKAVLHNLGSGYKLGGLEVMPELTQFIEMGEYVFVMFGVLALAMGAFIIFNTFRTVVTERRRDIGMLRAVGASRRSVLGLMLTETLLQGVIGTAVGMAAGYVFIAGLLAAINPVFEQRLQFSLGKPSFTPQTYVLSIGLGVGMTLLGGLYPALSASRVAPLEALRPLPPEVGEGSSRKRVLAGAALIVLAMLGLVSGNVGLSSLGVTLFLVALVVIAPALVRPISSILGRLLALAFAREGHLARGNLVRQPGRAAVTASAMMIGLAIVLATAGLVTSLTLGVWGFVDKSLSADYLLMPQSIALGAGGNVGAAPQLAQAIRDTAGVAAVTTLRASTTRIDALDLQVVGIDPATYPQLSGLEFSAGDRAQVYAEMSRGRAVVGNDLFAAQSQVHVGQELTLQTPAGPQVYRVVGIASDYLNMKMPTCYISQDNLEADFHEASDLLILANQTEGASPAAVQAALQALVQDYPAFTLFTSEQWREDLRQEGNYKLASLYVMLGFLAVPSLIALVNTLGINVLERTREIGVLRAVGATRRQVKRIILGESLLLAAAGTAFGILAGLWLGYVLVAAMNAIGFVMSYSFPYAGVLVTVAVGLLFGVLGALIPARQAARLDIVTALAYE